MPGQPTLESLPVGYFASVMATGIVALGAELVGVHWLAVALLVLAALAYVSLVVLTGLRAVRWPRTVLAELTSHDSSFSSLTFVAATNVLGAALAVVTGWWGLATGLWYVGVIAWVVLAPVTVIAVVLSPRKPGLAAGINGTWFLLTVSTQSVVVLGALRLRYDGGADLLAFWCVAAFSLGIVLYLVVMTMVFLRWTFHPLDPADADPPAWIAAGAVAITTMAGANLLLSVEVSPRLERLAPYLEAMVVMAWATATFWFPLMLAIGAWRHLVRRVPLRYHPGYWSLVFPLGTYAVATTRMRAAIDLDALGWLPTLTLVVAVGAWAATTAGLVHQLAIRVSRNELGARLS